MATPVGIVDWVEKNENLDALFSGKHHITVQPMQQGFEAEVVRFCADQENYVLKVWNKDSRPDVGFQFRLLDVLHERGLPVSKPLGWGMNPNGEKVLLTTFDGMPVVKVNTKKMTYFANLLTALHRLDVDTIQSLHLPRYNFIDYFFPGAREHADIWNPLVPLVQLASIKQDHLIHGDFHLNNIVENKERCTVIDWTNGQLGDCRYDFAWSLTLIKIYLSERYANVFRSAYLLETNIPQEELDVFEALACLRWMLLHQNGGAPGGAKTIARVRNIQASNPYLVVI